MNRLKKTIFLFAIFTSLFGCRKSQLDIDNPNAPTAFSLTSENGIYDFALGVINKQFGQIANTGYVNLFVIALTQHSIMGDELFSPYGNFGFRWANQVYSIQPPTRNTPVINPLGVTQLTTLQNYNNREAGESNVFLYEWNFAYNYITQCNQLLQALNNDKLVFSGNPSEVSTKKAVLRAWAYWWKGFAYSRIGSIYLAGLKVDEAGVTTNNYVSHDFIIDEANHHLDIAIALLESLGAANNVYNNTMQAITPSYNSPDKIIDPLMWIHNINTLKARNLLVNKKSSEINASDWAKIIALVQNGITESDNVFVQGMTADGKNDVAGGFFHPYILLGTTQEYTFVSERLIQEFHEEDKRLSDNFIKNGIYPPNIRGRGLQFGTRWTVKNIENGGHFATNNNIGSISIACTYEENDLMKAEALINTGHIEEGLKIIDDIRAFQHAEISEVYNSGLNLDQANAELRRERRVALFMRGTAFYDARRWGITKPLMEGGGRNNAMVYLPVNYLESGSVSPDIRSCLLDYHYVDYFDVPANELDFNIPSVISAPIKN